MRRFAHLPTVFTLIFSLGLLPLSALAQTPTLPSKPIPPVQPSTPPAPPPPPPQVPMAPPSTPPQDPGYQKARNLLDALDDLSKLKDIKNPQDAANKKADIIAKLKDLNLADALGTLGSVMTNPSATDLVNIAGILRAQQNGDLTKALNGLYDELNRHYNMPNLSPDERNKIAAQMGEVYNLLKNPSLISGALNKLKSDLEQNLKQAGMDAAAKALNDLIGGHGDPKELEGLLKGVDLNKLKKLFEQNKACHQNAVDDVMKNVMGKAARTGNHNMIICK